MSSLATTFMTYTGAVLALLYLLWLGYVLTMSLAERWTTLPLASKVLGLPAALFSWSLDVLLNVVLLSLIAWERPHELTITKRLHRWQHPDSPHRWARFAKAVCKHLLNPFDPDHC